MYKFTFYYPKKGLLGLKFQSKYGDAVKLNKKNSIKYDKLSGTFSIGTLPDVECDKLYFIDEKLAIAECRKPWGFAVLNLETGQAQVLDDVERGAGGYYVARETKQIFQSGYIYGNSWSEILNKFLPTDMTFIRTTLDGTHSVVRDSSGNVGVYNHNLRSVFPLDEKLVDHNLEVKSDPPDCLLIDRDTGNTYIAKRINAGKGKQTKVEVISGPKIGPQEVIDAFNPSEGFFTTYNKKKKTTRIFYVSPTESSFVSLGTYTGKIDCTCFKNEDGVLNGYFIRNGRTEACKLGSDEPILSGEELHFVGGENVVVEYRQGNALGVYSLDKSKLMLDPAIGCTLVDWNLSGYNPKTKERRFLAKKDGTYGIIDENGNLLHDFDLIIGRRTKIDKYLNCHSQNDDKPVLVDMKAEDDSRVIIDSEEEITNIINKLSVTSQVAVDYGSEQNKPEKQSKGKKRGSDVAGLMGFYMGGWLGKKNAEDLFNNRS